MQMTWCRQIRPGSRLWDVIAIAAVDGQCRNHQNACQFLVCRPTASCRVRGWTGSAFGDFRAPSKLHSA